MKRKAVIIGALASGLALVCLSVVLTIFATRNIVDIIGGASWYTFRFVFRYGKNGLYSSLSTLGIVAIAVSGIVAIFWKKK